MTEPLYDLTAEQAEGIKTCMEDRLADDIYNQATADHMSNVGFRGKAHYGEGALKLWCESNVALEWLRRAVETIASPIAGTKLVVRPQSEIQRRILCGLLIPNLTRDINDIRHILTIQNKTTVNVRSWTLVKAEKQAEKETPGIYLLLRIPEPDVEKLRQQDRRLNWMFGNIYIRILEDERGASSNSADDPAPAPPGKTPQVPDREPEPILEEMETNIDSPLNPTNEDRFQEDEGSEYSESCLDSSPLRPS